MRFSTLLPRSSFETLRAGDQLSMVLSSASRLRAAA